MRLFRRNALGIYAVYAAAIVSGLLVTPIVLHALGDGWFGIWSFIGSLTIYLSVLDFGVGPSIIRFAAEARGRRSPEDTNALASTGWCSTRVIGLATLPIGLALAWLVPELITAPDDLVWSARISTLLRRPLDRRRFPLGLFNNLLVAQQRFDLQNLANFVSTVLYAVLVAHSCPARRRADPARGADVRDDAAPARAAARLAPPRAPRARLSRVRLARAHPRADVVQLEQLPRPPCEQGGLLDRRRGRRDRARPKAAALYAIPAKLFASRSASETSARACSTRLAEHEGSGEIDRQRRLLLAGLRGGRPRRCCSRCRCCSFPIS